jgi:hypothetical protein
VQTCLRLAGQHVPAVYGPSGDEAERTHSLEAARRRGSVGFCLRVMALSSGAKRWGVPAPVVWRQVPQHQPAFRRYGSCERPRVTQVPFPVALAANAIHYLDGSQQCPA